MRKADIVNRIASEAFVTGLAAETVVDVMFSEIAEALARGEKTTVCGFGTFAATSRPARMGRNPATGERIEIPASRSVSFKASRALTDTVS